MRRAGAPVAVVLALVGAVPVLLLLDDDARAWGFRGYCVVVAFFAGRSIIRWTSAAGVVSPDGETDPFARPYAVVGVVSGWLQRHRRRRPALRGSALLVHTAMSTAGGAHHRLRPVIQEIADERLRTHGAAGLDADGAAARFIRPERPAPTDRLAPGLTAAEIDAILSDLENM